MTTAQQHGCEAVINTPDQLGDQWEIVCECNYRTSRLTNLQDVISMFGFHCMEVILDKVYLEKGINVATSDRDNSRAVRRNWFRVLPHHRDRSAAAAPGPQRVARHYHPALWDK
jgi:hypothetical protein